MNDSFSVSSFAIGGLKKVNCSCQNFAECLVVYFHHLLIGFSIVNSQLIDLNFKCLRNCLPQRAPYFFKITRSHWVIFSTIINSHDRLNGAFELLERLRLNLLCSHFSSEVTSVTRLIRRTGIRLFLS